MFAGVARTFEYAESTQLPAFTLTALVGYERREATDPGQEQHRPKLTVTVESFLGPAKHVKMALSQLIEGQIYSGGYSHGQDDVHLVSSLAFGCQLDPVWSLSFGGKFEHFESNKAGHDYSIFEIGPKLIARW
jgi:hypothetical protein